MADENSRVDANGVEWVKIEHPDVEGPPAEVTREAFDQESIDDGESVYVSYSDRGWKLVGAKSHRSAASTVNTVKEGA